jgi:[acyl-carrier-protein] S-malonyltransferase
LESREDFVPNPRYKPVLHFRDKDESFVFVNAYQQGIEAASAHAKTLGIRRVMALSVGGAFHTPLMASACDGLAAALADVALQVPAKPVVSNEDGNSYDDGDGWRTRLPVHVTRPVRWRTSMETLVGLGAESFIEVGHGSMIAGVAKRTVPETPVIACGNPEDLYHMQEQS